MINVLGLDISLSCGYAVISSTKELKTYGCIKIKVKDLKARVDTLVNEVLKIVDQFHPVLIVIEQTYFGPSATTTALLNKFQGAVLSHIPSNILVIFVNASSARKTVLGKGKKHSKEDVFNWAVDQYKLKDLIFKKHNDITDAILLAHLGCLKN